MLMATVQRRILNDREMECMPRVLVECSGELQICRTPLGTLRAPALKEVMKEPQQARTPSASPTTSRSSSPETSRERTDAEPTTRLGGENLALRMEVLRLKNELRDVEDHAEVKLTEMSRQMHGHYAEMEELAAWTEEVEVTRLHAQRAAIVYSQQAKELDSQVREMRHLLETERKAAALAEEQLSRVQDELERIAKDGQAAWQASRDARSRADHLEAELACAHDELRHERALRLQMEARLLMLEQSLPSALVASAAA